MDTKHYITEQNGFVINGFSTAFQQPTETDVCINEDGGRHFQLNGVTNPQIKDDEGFSFYKYINGEVLPATQEEQPQYTEVKEAKAIATFKAEREALVASITVTTLDGYTFDGDEVSQGRMARAIVSMDDVETVTWVLANNTVLHATKAQLQEALKMAGIRQTEVWTL